MDNSKSIDPIQFMEALPHGKALGMQLIELGDGTAVLGLPYDKRFVGDPETGVIHGGPI
ncbi:MAG: thioesterase, partial [Paracoccaceae bacterium]|nr:thioesterase [Paracoccaceae bacterium]